MSQAKDVLAEIQALKMELERKNVPKMPLLPVQTPEKMEKDMSSAEWLAIHGLKAVNTRFYSALKNQAFRHCDSVVKCGDEEKLVNAKYCENFAHVKWFDGTVKHVMINKTFFEEYKLRIDNVNSVLDKRIQWLKESSRQVFGTLIEDNVSIILDTSASMERHLPCLQKKLERLITEQLRHRIMFNLIMFGSSVDSLYDGVVRVSPVSLQAAWKWCSALRCAGSTNTLGALRKALSDPLVHGIYLLSDGRPDFPEEKILQQVSMYKAVPIHTISFNCNDTEANQFLARLAQQTGGRFHVVSSSNEGYIGPEPYESQDIKLLRLEREAAELDMKKMTELRAECALLEWRTLSKETPVKEESPNKRKNVKRPKSSESERSTRSSTGSVKERTFNAKKWLAKHGLMARRLTIMDALAPTLITQEPKYVGILKKKVHAKVFDDIMPFIYLSPQDKGKVRFVNPAAVDLVSYEKQLQCAIAAYDKQMSMVIWAKLEEADRAKFMLDTGETSPGFIENRALFESVLERLKWPVAKSSLDLMTAEIKLAQLYLTQSEQLREQLSNDRKKPEASPPARKTSTSSSTAGGGSYLLGNRVTAQNNIDGFYYPGLVIESHARQSCVVEFEDFDRQQVAVTNLIPIKGSTARPKIISGDYVLVQLILDKAQGSKPVMYAPGLVTAAPERTDQPAYAVLLFTGEKLVASRNDIIKITKKRYTTTSSTIYKLLNRQRSSQRLRLVAEGTQGDDTASIASTLDEILKTNRMFEDNPKLEQMLETPRIEEAAGSEATVSDSEGEGDNDALNKSNDVEDVNADVVMKQYADVGSETQAMAKVTLECGLQVGGYDISAQTDISNDFWDDLRAVKGSEVVQEAEIFIDDVPMPVSIQGRMDVPVLKVSATTPIQTDDILSIPDTTVLHQTDMDRTIELEEETATHSNRQDIIESAVRGGLPKGHTVLARWAEEGWYFRGKVLSACTGGYTVEDNNGQSEDILHKFILTDEADGKHRLTRGDHVVALHPDYSYSYAPAKVEGTEDNWFYTVTFYEGTEADIPREEMYYMSTEHYLEDVALINSIETALLGNFVLARDDSDGLYRRAVVTKCTGRMYEVNIVQGDGSALQDPSHVFTDKRKGGTVTARHTLCPLDSTHNTYGPCSVVKVNEDSSLHVKFYDDNEVYSVQRDVVFDISRDYYVNAANFIKSRS